MKRKKTLSYILIICLVCALFSPAALAADVPSPGDPGVLYVGGWMDAAKLCQSGYRGGSGNCWGSDLKRQKIGCRICFTIFDE